MSVSIKVSAKLVQITESPNIQKNIEITKSPKISLSVILLSFGD